jgi:gamma-glutamylcyclotransferase (GGCT)/AIG2-like uncharacterized protein YtfP
LEGTSNLFVYGTLLLDDVVSALLDRIPHHQDATAPGWQVVRLPHKHYPGLVPGHGEATGKVFTDLTETEWATLDTFEDPAYTLTAVQVLPPLETDAFAYIWPGEHINQLWSTADLGRDDLAIYLDRCRKWRQRYDQRTS